MASLLIRNVDESLHARLKARAAEHRRSLAEEVRELLRTAVALQETASQDNLAISRGGCSAPSTESILIFRHAGLRLRDRL